MTRFEPPNCADGFGGSELYFDYYEGDAFVSTSSRTTCPASWPNDTIMYYDSLQSCRLAIWEADAVFDDLIVGVCVDGVVADGCDPIPLDVLHDGEWSIETPEGFNMELAIELVE